MILIIAQKGFTGWGFQIGRLWGQINYPSFWLSSGFGFITWEKS